MTSLQQRALDYIAKNPGRTAREIAEGVFAVAGTDQHKIYPDLQKLWQGGHVEQFVIPGKRFNRYSLPDGVPEGATLVARGQLHVPPATTSRSAIDRAKLERMLTKAAVDVIQRLHGDENDRMHSWAHCFHHFQAFRKSVTDRSADQAALHLGFYLASYGMYRGGTALLQKDYRFLKPVVIELTDPAYVRLGVSPPSVADATSPVRSAELFRACQRLEEFLRARMQQKPSGTLVTKILLGTWANVPAFDRVFRDALKQTGFASATYNEKNFLRAFASLNSAAEVFQGVVTKFHEAGLTDYTSIRVIDAVFWHLAGGDRKTSEDSIEV